MTAAPVDVRPDLHRLIDVTQNQSLLQAVYTILTAVPLPPLELSDAEREAIDEGLRQLDNGEGIPHEEAMAETWAKYGRI